MRLENCQVVGCHPAAQAASSLRGSSARHRKPASVQQRRTPPAQVPALGKPAELVVMRNVTIRYGPRIILERVNWRIVAGESWALLGPNGSGKTTLLSLILGDHPQVYANEIAVFGFDRGSGESVWEIKRHIGWVSPELQTSFDSSMTCLAVVASGFKNTTGLFERPTWNQRKRAGEWLRLFGLAEHHDWPMEALSAGQARCLLLARALVKSPKLLILDEPCQGLDDAHRDVFLACLDRWIRAKVTTVVYVTHRPEEIPPSIKRIFRLEKR
jgi:molybdate transport system ATP-binding protein